jgi:hypothetical protein
MIFAARLESGTGGVQAIKERIAQAYRRGRPADLHQTHAPGGDGGSVFVADRVGLMSLIANGAPLAVLRAAGDLCGAAFRPSGSGSCHDQSERLNSCSRTASPP